MGRGPGRGGGEGRGMGGGMRRGGGRGGHGYGAGHGRGHGRGARRGGTAPLAREVGPCQGAGVASSPTALKGTGEGRPAQPEKTLHLSAAVDRDRCTGCGACVEACPDGAISMVGGVAAVDPTLCAGCGCCISECPAEALSLDHGASAHGSAR
jgi:NAD-dependent dihydropyrimidine dehydrogenase PreA subunit